MEMHPVHPHVRPHTVLLALAVTLFAALIELFGSARSGSLFLAADASHLLAHIGIFFVLLIPTERRWHDRGEDFATIAVLLLVLSIATGIAWGSLNKLSDMPAEPPAPSFMLLALFGLGANLTTAYLFKSPAETQWSFRAALAHELSDGALTVVGLFGALAIKLFGFHWVDPGLSMAIALWLGIWSLRLLLRRVQIGRLAWVDNGH